LTAAALARRLAALEAKAPKPEDPNRPDLSLLSEAELVAYALRVGAMTEDEGSWFLSRLKPVSARTGEN
jgi:hypothetical protein